jgi:hypothetical protein
MTKEGIIKNIEEIDVQLKRNRELIINSKDVDTLPLCDLSNLLVDIREMWQIVLLENYGFYYMRES